jgi:hypothetical protein
MDVTGEALLYDEIRLRGGPIGSKVCNRWSSLKKEKSHVVDYRRRFNHFVAARLFRPEYQLQLPTNRQLDPYPARDCGHSHRFAAAGDREFLNRRRIDWKGRPVWLPLYTPCIKLNFQRCNTIIEGLKGFQGEFLWKNAMK